MAFSTTTAFCCASSRNDDGVVFSSSSSSSSMMMMIRRRRLESSSRIKNPSTSFSKNPLCATMERSDTTTTTGAKDGATTGRRRANRFSVLVDRGGVVVDRVRDAFLSVQSDGTITTTTKKKKKKKKKKRRKAEDDEKDDAVVVLFSARRETTRRNEEEETTAIENAVWPRELVREEEAMREKDRMTLISTAKKISSRRWRKTNCLETSARKREGSRCSTLSFLSWGRT